MRRNLLLFLVVGSAYAIGSQLAFSWFGADGVTSSFFPAAGVTMAALLLVERRRWPVVLAAAATAEFLLDLAHDIGPSPALGYVVANTVQPLVGALALTTLVRRRIDLSRSRDLVAFLACGVVGATAVGAALGASTFILLDGGSGWGRFFAEWWVGDGLGVLVIGGAILSLSSEAPRDRRMAEAIALAAGSILATIALFWAGRPALVYVPVALLIVSGFRAGTRAVALTGAAVAFIAAQATAEGHSYWDALEVSPATGLLYLQLALGIVLVSALGVAAEVDGRERAAIGLASAERFRELADTAPAMLWVTDEPTRATFLSRGWYELTGTPEGTGLGHGWIEAIHPDDRERATAAMHRAAAAREPFALDYRLRRADGVHRWAIDSGRPRLGPDGELLGYVGSVIDAHERTQAEVALRESEARLRALFSSIDEGYCLCEIMLDPAGTPLDYRFLEANPLFGEMTGLRDAVGRTALELVPDLEREWVERYARVALDGEPIRFESGSEAMGRWFDVYATPVPPHGRFALVFKDVTERRRAEQALRDSELAERRARGRAELTSQVLSELEAVEGVAARAARLLELLVPRVADMGIVEIPGDDPVIVSAHADDRARRALDALRVPAGDAGDGAPPRIEAAAGASRARIVVPLDLGAGVRATMRLGLADPERRDYEPDDLAFVRGLGDAVGLLLARARVQEEDHSVALRLQRALLPEAPHPDARVAIAARYSPAGDVLEVGGDWYDAFALPDGRIALTVGDVVGHGLEAAAAMGRLRVALAAMAPLAEGPGHLLSLLHEFTQGPNGTPFATVCHGVLDPDRGILTYASAGHPPMLVVSPEGVPAWLDDGRSPPLCRLDVGERPQAEVELPPGSLLVMYSDGLVERRHEPLSEGLARLAGAACEASADGIERVCDRIMEAMGTGVEQEDDTVLLCLRLAPTAARRFHRVFPARADELRMIRAAVREWLDDAAIETDRVGLLLAVGEACSNSVEHAYPDGTVGEIEVDITDIGDDGLDVRVRDFGVWRPPSPPLDGVVRGRGTGLMRAVSRDFRRIDDRPGTTVAFRVPAPVVSR